MELRQESDIQSQILNLLNKLQQTFKLTYLFISHDLSVVRYIAQNVAVMYLGRIVEIGPVDEIFSSPKHPYTKALLNSIPRPDKAPKTKLRAITGTVPSPFEKIDGCPFHPRCEEFISGDCNTGHPPPLTTIKKNHQAACVKRQPLFKIIKNQKSE